MNVIDRIIGSVSPQRGLNRAVAREKLKIFASGYSNHGASRNQNWAKAWDATGGGPMEDIDFNLPILRQRSRDLWAGGGFARGALTTMRTSIVGAGLTVRPQIDADFLGIDRETAVRWQRSVAREFELWARSVDCDADRMNNFYELQQLAKLSWLMSGDAFALPLYIERPGSVYDLRIRLLEADRICTPGQLQDTGIAIPADDGDGWIFSGVEVNGYGETVAYHIANRHPLSFAMGYMEPVEWERVEAFGSETGRANILHLMEHERPEQRRGAPFLAPVMQELKQLSRYIQAEQMSAVINAMFTVFITTEGTPANLGEGVPPDEKVSNDPQDFEMGNGNIVTLRAGEKPEFAQHNSPGNEFEQFVTALCMSIGSALEIPYEILLKRFNSSFTASKAANNEFWRVVKMRRRWLVDDFCQPIYEEFLTEAIAKGRVEAPGFFDDPAIRAAYCNAEWHGPAPGHLNPLDETKAADMRVASGYSTRKQETAELNGGDWDENIQQCADEKSEMDRLGLMGGDVNGKKPDETKKSVEVRDPREEQRGFAFVR